jgi:hypothetical protein
LQDVMFLFKNTSKKKKKKSQIFNAPITFKIKSKCFNLALKIFHNQIVFLSHPSPQNFQIFLT